EGPALRALVETIAQGCVSVGPGPFGPRGSKLSGTREISMTGPCILVAGALLSRHSSPAVDCPPHRCSSFTREPWGRKSDSESFRRGVSVMFGLGSQELIVILVTVLVLLGADSLRPLALSRGSSPTETAQRIEAGKALAG